MDFTLSVGEELKIRDELFGADGLPGASYDDTIDAIWINAQDSVVQVMHNGKLNGTLKGISPGTSFLQVTIVNHAREPKVSESNITVKAVPPPIRDTVRTELVLDV